METLSVDTEVVTVMEESVIEMKKAEPGYYLEKAIERTFSLTESSEQITFAWNNLTVVAPEKKSKNFLLCKTKSVPAKTIVNQATGYVKPGELMAIMGASGAGKSTLLNSLTLRNIRNLDITGKRFINGIPIDRDELVAVSAYIQQDDLFIGSLTPREHLEFHAQVRMDKSIPIAERKKRVDSVIRELGLTKCQKTVIGVPGRVKGISGGERKRLAFATEILNNPPLLFCDEPTSGLDSYMAQSVIETLRELSRNGKTIVCTIHQPSSQVFELFDRVLLMAEGRIAFQGAIDAAYRFFSSVGYPCPNLYNPADHYVQVLAVTPGNEAECKQKVNAICHKFDESEFGIAVKEEVHHQETHRQNTPMLSEKRQKLSKNPYKVSWFVQFRALLWRSWLAVIKEPAIIQVNLGQTIFISILLGIIYLQQDYDQSGVFNINGVLFVIVTNLTFTNVFSVVNVFCLELPIFLREHLNGAYRTDVYFITKQLAELPIYLVTPTIMMTIMYWMIGLNPAGDRFVLAVVIAILVVQVVTSYGYLISTLASDLQVALGLAPPLMIPLLIFGGFFLRSNTVPAYLSWIEYISWFKYSNEAFVINQWKGYEGIECNPYNQSFPVDLPDFITCPPTLDCCSNGILDLPDNLTTTVNIPIPCQFENGSDVISQSGLDQSNFLFDVIMLLVMATVLRVFSFLALLYKAFRGY